MQGYNCIMVYNQNRDRLLFCILSMVSGVVVYYALSYLAALVLLLWHWVLPVALPPVVLVPPI